MKTPICLQRRIVPILLLFGVTSSAILAASTKECVSGVQFACTSGKCIPLSWHCDGDEDCPDADDELNCENLSCDKNKEFDCSRRSSGLRIPHSSNVRHSPARCIPLSWVCDGEEDCTDGSDEKKCKNITCDESQFTCEGFNGHPRMCIPASWKCDNQNDCGDNSDEKGCNQEQSCSANEFQCSNKVCIFHNWLCDGDDDCGDNSDELSSICPNSTCDPTEKFQCNSGGLCIPRDWVCDGSEDCKDRSDELNCSNSMVPPARKPQRVQCHHDYEFQCRTIEQCVNRAWLCDGEMDCSDGSDETDCAPSKCATDEKACDLGSCLSLSEWCDGKEDCFDGSDEKDCPTLAPKTVKCRENLDYTCPGTPLQCVAFEDMCVDGKANNDCSETVCNKEIELCDDGGNKYCVCRTTQKNGSICYCPRGFELKGRTCVDIDECAQIGRCAQKCVNIPGSFVCDCYPGYHLTMGKPTSENPSGVGTCRATGSDPFLLLSNRAAIRRFDLVTNKYEPLVAKLDSAVAMDFLHRNDTLVWSDVAKEKIMICHMGRGLTLRDVKECAEGEGNITLVEKDVSTPDGLAVDWVHQLLFWTDTGLDQINVVDLVTRRRRTLFSEGLDEPRAIAVDPSRGLIFWTDWGVHARIERAGMDGSDRTELISGDTIKWPNGLALDLLEQRVYWADAKVKLIMSCDYWGGDVRLVLRSHEQLKHPFSLAVFEERLYWTDWDREGVLTANKFTGRDFKTVMHGVAGPMTVRVYHEMAQPYHPNKCNQHDCEHMCLPRAHLPPKKDAEFVVHGLPYTCACINGFIVNVNNRNYCVKESDTSSILTSEPSAFSLPSLLVLVLLSALLIVGYLAYRRRPADFSLYIDNPVYRRTVEDIDADMDPFNDDGVQPSNPPVNGIKLVIDQNKKYNVLNTDGTAPCAAGTSLPTESMTAPLASSMVV